MGDILEDQKIFYIVKDYKRMFEQHNTLVKACKEYQKLLTHRDNRIRDLERQVKNLKNQVSKVIEYVEEARTLTK